MSILLRLSSRYAFSRQNRHRSSSIRIALGLALGLFAIVMVLSFMQALQANQFKDIRTLESFDLQLDAPTHTLGEARSIAAAIGALEGTEAAFVWADLPIIIQGEGGRTISARMRGIDASERLLEAVKSYRGTIFDEGIIASSWANSLWIDIGNQITLTFLRRGRQATIVPASKIVEVGAIYYTSSWEFDQTTLLCSLDTLAALTDDLDFRIGVYADADVKRVKEIISDAGYAGVMTYQEVNAALWGAMELEQRMMTLMLLLMIIIVLVHAYSSTRRLLLAKQREVAMLMTMGERRKTIRLAFVLQSFFVSVLGLAFGIGLSYGALALYPHLSAMIYRRIGAHLVLVIEAQQVIGLSLGILAFSLISTLLAIRRLLSADIMEMFVYEEIY
ncbi:MAG: FtsX-like permease family protein [Sphaerochaeta sp.]|nr:FtsX-like permease family protein [Sphaerochaeta sp.]